jgi:hypothetical protein
MGDNTWNAFTSNAQIQAHIRQVAKNSRRVFFTRHALERMKQRTISDVQVLDCLRNGFIQRPPTEDVSNGFLKCRMEYFGSARNLAVVVVLDKKDPDLLIVTVMTNTR